ncbi:MAG: membrane dipeptidase [Anaerolineales bacterium]
MIVDGHEDLAWNIQTFGRDYTRPVEETRAIEAGSAIVEGNGQTLLGWPDWIDGGVGLVFGVLFAAPERMLTGNWETIFYADPSEAHRLYWSQLDLYRRLADEHSEQFCLIESQPALQEHMQAWESGQRRLGLVLLMEGAEGVGEPAELEDWFERGVRIIGPAWDRTRYSGSCYDPGPLTAQGRELLEVWADLGGILDLSHLSEEAARQALDSFEGTIIASHANVRRLVPHFRYPERQLSDEVILGLIGRDGVIGVVLANHFLKDGWTKGDPKAAVTLDHVVDHIDAICQLAGNADHVGLGSDFDGGFGWAQVPAEIDSVKDLPKVGQALGRRGYADGDILKILGNNWIRILNGSLPASI